MNSDRTKLINSIKYPNNSEMQQLMDLEEEKYTQKIKQRFIFYNHLQFAYAACKNMLGYNASQKSNIYIEVILPNTEEPVLVLPKNNYWSDNVDIKNKVLLEKIANKAIKMLCFDVLKIKYNDIDTIMKELKTVIESIQVSLSCIIQQINNQQKYHQTITEVQQSSYSNEYFCHIKLTDCDPLIKNNQLTAKVHLYYGKNRLNNQKTTHVNLSPQKDYSTSELEKENNLLHQRISKLEQYLVEIRKKYQF